MIIGILGTVGSGKSISATRFIVENDNFNYTNLNVEAPNCMRIKKDFIVKEEITGHTKTGKPVKEHKVNWDYWNKALKKHKNYNIVLDEAHNLINSRRGMSKQNVFMGEWISQIRKLLGESEKTHIVFVSQRLKRLDNVAKDLFDTIIYCESWKSSFRFPMPCLFHGKIIKKNVPLVFVRQNYFIGENCMNRYKLYREGVKKARNFQTQFLANKYFKHNDTFKIVGESAYI